jgi:hypothetical protein
METGQRVAVYKNLHKQAWSVRAMPGPYKGRVIGHAHAITLVDCRTHVNCRAQQRIAGGAAREVHAWIVGTVSDTATLASPRRLTYRPHERAEFFVADTGEEIHSADIVAFDADGSAYI